MEKSKVPFGPQGFQQATSILVLYDVLPYNRPLRKGMLPDRYHQIMIQGEVREKIAMDGFAVISDVLSSSEVTLLLEALQNVGDSGTLQRRGGIFAVRNLLEVVPEIHQLARSEALTKLVEPVLGERFFPVRGILFDKIPDANWKVPWHQDVTIAVRERIEVEGFGPWSIKADVLHVQPPSDVLEKMISVRLHLDDCTAENGALRVISGSHLRGRISESAISSIRDEKPEHTCVVRKGGALLMKPLLLHASSPSLLPGHRRVIHIDFASVMLPGGLRWLGEGD
jgi:hypothetical protein